MIPDTMMLPSRSHENFGISPTKIHSPGALPVKVHYSASSSNVLWTIAGVPYKIEHVSRSKDAPLSQLVHPDLPKGANYVKSIANSARKIARKRSESVKLFNLIPKRLSYHQLQNVFQLFVILIHPEIWPRGRWLYHLKGPFFSFICWIMDFTLTTSSFLKDELHGSCPNTSFNILKSK